MISVTDILQRTHIALFSSDMEDTSQSGVVGTSCSYYGLLSMRESSIVLGPCIISFDFASALSDYQAISEQ